MKTQFEKSRAEHRKDLDELNQRRMIDAAWKQHMAQCREHTCSTCFQAGFIVGAGAAIEYLCEGLNDENGEPK